MSGTVVVDASLVVKWMVAEEYSAEAVAKLMEWRWDDVEVTAPSLLAYEIANALHKRILRGELSPARADEAFVRVFQGGLAVDYDQALHVRAMEMARTFRRPTSYDTHYLALAEREGCEFWTADERLWNAVRGNLDWVRWIGE